MENTIEDNKTIELRIVQSKRCGSGDDEGNNPILSDIFVTIEEWDLDNHIINEEIGSMYMTLINMGMAVNKDYDPLVQCLDHSDYLGTLASVFYSGYDFSAKITDVLGITISSDMLAINDITLKKEYHNRNIIEDSLKMIIEQYCYVPVIGLKSGEFEYDNADYESIGFKKIKTKVGYVYGLNNE